MNKRITAVLLAALLLISLVGCGTDTTADPHEGHSHTTTEAAPTTTSTTESAEVKFPLTLTVEKYQGEGQMYKDVSVTEVNYTLKLTANTDLKQLRLLSINPDTSLPDKALHTLTALKKGESQYVLTYINDAAPNRGVLCTDTKGNAHYYLFAFSAQSGSIELKEISPHA